MRKERRTKKCLNLFVQKKGGKVDKSDLIRRRAIRLAIRGVTRGGIWGGVRKGTQMEWTQYSLARKKSIAEAAVRGSSRWKDGNENSQRTRTVSPVCNKGREVRKGSVCDHRLEKGGLAEGRAARRAKCSRGDGAAHDPK